MDDALLNVSKPVRRVNLEDLPRWSTTLLTEDGIPVPSNRSRFPYEPEIARKLILW